MTFMRLALALAAALAGVLAVGAAGPALAGKVADAEAAFAANRDDEAMRLYGEAITESAGDPETQAGAYFGRGEVHALNARQEEAIADFTAALALQKDDASRANTLFSRAEAYNRRRQYERALVDYTETLKLGPGMVGVYFARSRVYRALDRRDEALADLEAELKINPTSYRALSTRAEMLGLPQPKTDARGF
jgi:tetratricopeptide (TPR) repeat protein